MGRVCGENQRPIWNIRVTAGIGLGGISHALYVVDFCSFPTGKAIVSKPDSPAPECRLWVVQGAPHVGYCTMTSDGEWCEVLLYFNGTLVLSRLFDSIVVALMYAGAERDGLVARGWTIADSLDLRAPTRPAASPALAPAPRRL